jgi:hypothetical protein
MKIASANIRRLEVEIKRSEILTSTSRSRFFCDHQNEVEPGEREIACEMCRTPLNVYEDGTTDLM